MALPETALAFAAVYLFYHKAPLRIRSLMGNAWIYDACEYGQLRKNQVLSRRITAFSMLETLILYLAALFCTNLLAAGAERTPFSLSYILSKWQDNLRLAPMMMCVGVPIAYLFNRFIMRSVVFPINQMSNYMIVIMHRSTMEAANTNTLISISAQEMRLSDYIIAWKRWFVIWIHMLIICAALIERDYQE